MSQSKPLGGKAYGSIGHLPASRLGPGDYSVHEGQARICCEKPRKGDRIIVTEKLDGACMVVANIEGSIVALSRAGYRAETSPFVHIREFEGYVQLRNGAFSTLLQPGERIAGEWLSMAHGTRYEPSAQFFSPYMAFDLFRDGKRVLRDEFRTRIEGVGIDEPIVLHDGPTGYSIERMEVDLGDCGFSGAIDPAEGAVWRVEREGRVDFLAKFVRHSKVDGKYLPEISGQDPIWHWRSPVSVPA